MKRNAKADLLRLPPRDKFNNETKTTTQHRTAMAYALCACCTTKIGNYFCVHARTKRFSGEDVLPLPATSTANSERHSTLSSSEKRRATTTAPKARKALSPSCSSS